MSTFEDKSITVLRRKFLLAIPVSMALGYVGTGLLVARFSSLGRWARRGLRLGGLLGAPLGACMLIAHFNRAEIFRAGTSMMREMGELRKLEEGPFADPRVREKWDSQVAVRRVGKGAKGAVEYLGDEDGKKMDYSGIVDGSVSQAVGVEFPKSG